MRKVSQNVIPLNTQKQDKKIIESSTFTGFTLEIRLFVLFVLVAILLTYVLEQDTLPKVLLVWVKAKHKLFHY